MRNLDIKKRREALKLSQTALATEVAKRSGQTFTQQALQKLESPSNPNASSRFMHYILDILDEREAGPRAKVKKAVDLVPDENLEAALRVLEALARNAES
jgi:transcriptional regulator with XRE-family HTH domain